MKHSGDAGPSLPVLHASGVGAVVLALVAGYAFVVAPVLNKSSERGQLQQLISSDSSRLQALNAEALKLRNELESGQATILASGVELLERSGQNTRLAEITGLANACGLRLDSLQPGVSRQEELFLVTPITMRGVGQYDAVATFLSQTLSRFPDVSVRTFRLEARVEGERRLASFEFDLAWYADPADQSGAETPENGGTAGG